MRAEIFALPALGDAKTAGPSHSFIEDEDDYDLPAKRR